jgi:RHS repeat-associated protein
VLPNEPNQYTFKMNLEYDSWNQYPDWERAYKLHGSYGYFGARYYSSDLGIWISVDPLASKYSNLSPYAYVANNPIKLVDPNGMEIEDGLTDPPPVVDDIKTAFRPKTATPTSPQTFDVSKNSPSDGKRFGVSVAQGIQAETFEGKAESSLDVMMNGVGLVPVIGTGVSLFWNLGGKTLFNKWRKEVLIPQIEMGVSPMDIQGFK